MAILKFPSLINHYKRRDVDQLILTTSFQTLEPIVDDQWVMLEKIDGANFQIEIKDEIVRFGTRNEYIHAQSFFNYQEAMQSEDIQKLIAHMKTLKTDMIIFGELFGKGIQNRVNYGDGRYFRVFDIQFITEDEKKRISWRNVRELMTGFEHLLVPEIGRVAGFEKVMEFDIENKKSLILNNEDNYMEGLVARSVNYPMDTYVKYKSAAFNEKMVKPKKAKEPIIYSEAQNMFRTYLTENRMLSVFSKYGPIVSTTQIPKYLTHIMNDAIIDYIGDGGEVCEVKQFNSDVSKLLMNFLRG